MSTLFVCLGIVLLYLTYCNIRKNETEPLFFFVWFDWFDSLKWNVNRFSSPLLFWITIIAQSIGGFYLMYIGLIGF